MSAIEQTRPRSYSKDDLVKKGSQLKKATTKEYSDQPSDEEVEAIKKVWDEKCSNPQILAAHFEIDGALLMDNLPEDVVTFAKGLFAGLYTADKDEAAKDRLRQRLRVEILRTTNKLRKSVTKENTGPSEEDLAAAVKLYSDAAGDLAKIAKTLSLDDKLFQNDPPLDAKQFAEKLFAGNYTLEEYEVAKQRLREVLRPEILKRRPSLKHTTTKEGAELGEEDQEVALAMKLYPGRNVKEIDAVAEKLGMSAQHIKADPGESAKEFALKLLSGAYTADKSELSKAQLRTKLESAIKERRPSLHKVTQRRMSNVSDQEITNFSAFFTKKGGNLEAIATESGLPLESLRANPPANASDFVLKLLSGTYTVDMNEQAKATLRACMRQEMLRTSKLLNKSETKEWDGKADEEDVKLIAAAYTQRNGDLKHLATRFSLSIALLEAKPPVNAEDFAKQVLLGNYTTA